jgi:CxxC-x17-CxxC domain-containing protein
MNQGNWTCSGCGAAITSLPFEPRDTSNLKCIDCFKKGKSAGAPSTGSSSQGGDKPRFAGDWKCSGCGGAITSLPFEPRDTTNLKCIDCFKKSKG